MNNVPAGGLPQHRKLLERCRAAAEAESAQVRAEQWRDVSMEKKGEIIAQLMNLAYLISYDRIVPYEKPPLNFPRFSTSRDART